MRKVQIIDRVTKKKVEEEIYGKRALALLYGRNIFAKVFSKLFIRLLAKFPLFSNFYAKLQKRKKSVSKIKPFIKAFKIDLSELEKGVKEFSCFDDFFVRKLKPAARSIDMREGVAILPADARYLVFPNVSKSDGFYVKGQKFSLEEFLQSNTYAKIYEDGAMMIGRLSPVDYHRFHFPVDCVPLETKFINGYLYSVNPLAIRRNINIFCENKRVITPLHSDIFGTILFIEVGATCVGSIHQTFIPNQTYKKGEEKGYFSFGGSSIVLLFERDKIKFDQDLIDHSQQKIETRGLFGQSLGSII